ncbi:MAG: MarR family transcriptional regulator [Proteobacteria bacterium]|nr:MarR family transcriptional regulator [Pseudomonadota bacterium]
MDTMLQRGETLADPFPPNWQYDPLTGIGRVLARLKITLMEAMDAELAAFDITSAQYVVMVNLGSGQADSTASLCKGVSYDPGAMTRMLDRLEKKGLVTRERCPEDRRKVRLALTPAGTALYPDIVAAAGRVVRSLLRGFSAAEVTQLEQLLARMLANGAAVARPDYDTN